MLGFMMKKIFEVYLMIEFSVVEGTEKWKKVRED